MFAAPSSLQLHVHVVEASDLPRTDFLGPSDLYMTFQLSTSSAIQSTAVIKQTHSPIWNEKFHFAVVDPARAVLIGTVKSPGIIGGDTPLAKIELPICSLVPHHVTEMWYDVQPPSGQGSHPTVRIVLQAAPPGHPAFVPIQVAPAQPGPMGRPRVSGPR